MSKEEEYTQKEMIAMLVCGIVIGLFAFLMIIYPNFGYVNDVKELGQAICEEEADMNFVSYSTSDGLKCSGKLVRTKTYDGIKVELMED